MLTPVLFESPARFAADLASGALIRYGAILKDASTGVIVGHMQESGLAQIALTAISSGLPSPFSLATGLLDTGAGIYTAVQVRHLTDMMESLQLLQVATLGVSLVGVGVSVAGFMYMRKRFDALEGKLQELERTVQVGFEQQHKASRRPHFSLTKGLVERARLAASLSDSRSEYMQIAAALSDEASFFEGELDFMLKSRGPIDLALFWQLAQALMLCNSFRIDCRIRASELRNALHVSEQVAADYQRLFDGITPVSFDASLDDGVATVNFLRDVTDAAASKPYLLDYLRTRRIDGPGYLGDLDREKERPLLILRAA